MSESIQNQSRALRKSDWGRIKAPVRTWANEHFEFVILAMAFSAMTIAYVIVFQVARNEAFSTSVSAGLRNVGAILPIAIFVRYCVRGPIRRFPWPAKLLAHIALACFASLAWYTLVLFLRNWSLDWMQSGVTLTPFSQKASFWHLYQGLIVYAALVAAFYAFLLNSELEKCRQTEQQPEERARHRNGVLFVKSNDEFLRLEFQDVAHISANNDSVTIHARHQSFRSSRNLKDLDRELQAFGFVRIHRSHLINSAMVRSAEPTGDGRLTLHLLNNKSLISSRAGAKRFRDLVSV